MLSQSPKKEATVARAPGSRRHFSLSEYYFSVHDEVKRAFFSEMEFYDCAIRFGSSVACSVRENSWQPQSALWHGIVLVPSVWYS